MPKFVAVRRIGAAMGFVALNVALWVYFWVSFFLVSEPYDPRPFGHHPVDLYCVFGHAIGQTANPFQHRFMVVMFWVEFPSFALATTLQRVFLPTVSADALLFGISIGGYRLIVTMVFSFLQWYLLGKLSQRFSDWFRRVALPARSEGRG